MTRNRLSPLALTLLLAATGCSHIKTPAIAFTDDGEFLPGEVGEGLVVSPNPLIPDVPMPIGFKAVPSQSTWHYDGRVRVVSHLYQGHAKQGDAVAFYRDNLPTNHWTLIDIQANGDQTVMRYTKGPERLAVSVDHFWGVTSVKVQIEAR